MLTKEKFKKSWLDCWNRNESSLFLNNFSLSDRVIRLISIAICREEIKDREYLRLLEWAETYADDKISFQAFNEETREIRLEIFQSTNWDTISVTNAIEFEIDSRSITRTCHFSANTYSNFCGSQLSKNLYNDAIVKYGEMLYWCVNKRTFKRQWRTSTAVALAHEIYNSKDWSAMPILADALQDAGCDDIELLEYCRDSNSKFFRGIEILDKLMVI